jgi:glycolate oxidase
MWWTRQRSPDPLTRDLEAAIGADHVAGGASARLLYSRDASIISGGRAGAVCLPDSTEQVAACIRIARAHGRSFVPRGAGTGLAGGAVPSDGSVVISTTRMNRILEVDVDRRIAWVEPGVINLELTRHLAGTGLHFAPDPSSQSACTIGGNVGTNAGGPHCLLYGVTSVHVAAVEVVLPDGDVVVLGEEEGDAVGYDLRGAFVGGEGTLGIATRIAVHLTPDPPAVRTMLLDFMSIEEAADTVSAVIAAGMVPSALELMDQQVVQAVEPFANAGYSLDAAAVLIVELDGLSAGVAQEAEAVELLALQNGARSVRVAADEEERARIWKGRKAAFGAIATIKPAYYLHDTVIPRTRLAEVISGVNAIAERHGLIGMNVFHAGDGNLHPLLVFDDREPGIMDHVYAASEEIVRLSLEVGGVLSGEHGIGLEKRRFMPLLFSPEDLAAQRLLRDAFDPDGVSNPDKVLPDGPSCGEIQDLPEVPEGTWV